MTKLKVAVVMGAESDLPVVKKAIDQLDAVTGDRTTSGALALEAGVDLGLWDTAFGRLEEAAQLIVGRVVEQ